MSLLFTLPFLFLLVCPLLHCCSALFFVQPPVELAPDILFRTYKDYLPQYSALLHPRGTTAATQRFQRETEEIVDSINVSAIASKIECIGSLQQLDRLQMIFAATSSSKVQEELEQKKKQLLKLLIATRNAELQSLDSFDFSQRRIENSF